MDTRYPCKNVKNTFLTKRVSTLFRPGCSNISNVSLRCALLILLCYLYISNSFHFFRVPINFLLVNLAVADILFATFIAPDVIFSVFLTHPDGLTGTILCKLLTGGNFAWVGAAASAFTFSAVAIERYYAVMHPLSNKGKLTKRKIKVCYSKHAVKEVRWPYG